MIKNIKVTQAAKRFKKNLNQSYEDHRHFQAIIENNNIIM